MKILILIVAFAAAVNASGSEYDRVCRTAEMSPRVKSGFQLLSYLGTWFEIRRYEASNQVEFDCAMARYSLSADGSVQVTNSGYAPGGQFIEFIGRGTVAFPNQSPLPSKLMVTFFPGQPEQIYWVMSTDYSNYSVVWSCIDLAGGRSREQVWVLSRTPTLSAATSARVSAVIAENNFPLETFRETSQDLAACRA